jgi:hypothetical protein
MKKLIVAMTCTVSVTAFAQTPKLDSIQRVQIEYTRFADSIGSHTTVKEFDAFLDETVTRKFYREGTFADLYQYFINTKWANRNIKPPKK